ncbi:phosphoacetylglucosamine mutase isoform X2 [Bacillus rossius redtenbacheri]|uniref:phosphoacetylglucosamine mutase isoform X2 n=1 Tax=Bacillus rossius redtenbacheri TaxID=93214 RepID=UPI002FDD6C39
MGPSNCFIEAAQVGRNKFARKVDKDVHYGTAGFREKAEVLDHIIYRMGLLAVLRAKHKNATIGLMITASHNPEPDNGVKLIDPRGEMLEASWEKIASKLANARPSSPRLAAAAVSGVTAMCGRAQDYAVVTTPMLHFFVACRNAGAEATEGAYRAKLSAAFNKLCARVKPSGHYKPHVVFDGANGVGALKMKELAGYLSNNLTVDIHNEGSGKLNHMCGADYVKVQQRAPEGVPASPGARCVSVDGDADRLVYFFTGEDGAFHLLDGDRIATLVAGYLMELVRASGLAINLGLVQTAYANGGSTHYIADVLKVPVACAKTGVKFLHEKALEFDIGVYFEANGHGTVIASEKTSRLIKDAISKAEVPPGQRAAAEQLADVFDVINQTVGDALSDLLLVETILRSKGWDARDWLGTYADLPNRQLKVTVQDRRVVQTTDAERVCVSPEGLQSKIDELVAKFERGRAFVRPSGTEDVVRVYAEADSQRSADRLAALVAAAVHQVAGGVGDAPAVP